MTNVDSSLHHKFHYWQGILGLKALSLFTGTVLYSIAPDQSADEGEKPTKLGWTATSLQSRMSAAKKGKSANSKVISPGNIPLHGPSTLQVEDTQIQIAPVGSYCISQ